jgi:hypothetical protein
MAGFFWGAKMKSPVAKEGSGRHTPHCILAGFIICLLKKRLRDDDRSKRRL